MIRIRPASEHDGRTPAIWLYYRTDEAGVPQREYVGAYGMQLESQYLYWFPVPELADPEVINALPAIGERTRKKRSAE